MLSDIAISSIVTGIVTICATVIKPMFDKHKDVELKKFEIVQTVKMKSIKKLMSDLIRCIYDPLEGHKKLFLESYAEASLHLDDYSNSLINNLLDESYKDVRDLKHLISKFYVLAKYLDSHICQAR